MNPPKASNKSQVCKICNKSIEPEEAIPFKKFFVCSSCYKRLAGKISETKEILEKGQREEVGSAIESSLNQTEQTKKCPNCGLFNPPSALRCDCGYSFDKSEVNANLREEYSYEQKSNETESSTPSRVDRSKGENPINLIRNKTVLWAGLIIAIVAIIGFYIYLQRSPEDKAVELVKKSYALGAFGRVEDKIQYLLNERKGILRIIGWKAQRIDDQTYLVSYTFDEGSGKQGYFFEVNLVAGLVRTVLGNPSLEEKYGIVGVANKDLEVVDYRLDVDKYGYLCVVGTVKNKSNSQYSMVRVDFNLYDKDGAQVGTESATIDNLEPKGIWKFKANILSSIQDKVSTTKLKGIIAFTMDGRRIDLNPSEISNHETGLTENRVDTKSLTQGEFEKRFRMSEKTYTKARISFSSNYEGNDEIYVMDIDGRNLRNLTNHPAKDWDPSWSPDGQKIAFVSNRDGTDEIYVMEANGKNPRRLTNHPASDTSPSWSPDGRKITFISVTQQDGNVEIYIMDADGNNLRNLTNHPAIDFSPSWSPWSPDGRKIAFVSNRDGDDEIYIMDADGNNLRNLTNHPAMDFSPSWSPDGQRIAFDSDRGRKKLNKEIYVIDADGRNLRNLTNLPAGASTPSWSPDGQKIAFISHRDPSSMDLEQLYKNPFEFYIMVMDVDGKNQNKLASLFGFTLFPPLWSSDSQRLYFVVIPLQKGNDKIYVLDVNSKHLQNLTDYNVLGGFSITYFSQ